MTTVPITLTQTDNLTYDASRAVFRKTFPSAYASRNDKIALLSCSIYYSWFNVTSAFGNTTGVSYTFDGTTYPVNFPEGFYPVSDLSGYIQFTMKNNGHYLVDENGKEVYFLSLVLNTVNYAVTLVAKPVSASLPTNWTNPASMALTGTSPQLVIADTNWRKLIGFATGTFPSTPSAVEYRVNSTTIPQITPVSTVLIGCNMVNDSRFSNYPNIIGSFVPNVDFGALMNYQPQVLSFFDVSANTYEGISIQFFTQDYIPLQIKDPSQTVISLLLQQG